MYMLNSVCERNLIAVVWMCYFYMCLIDDIMTNNVYPGSCIHYDYDYFIIYVCGVMLYNNSLQYYYSVFDHFQ